MFTRVLIVFAASSSLLAGCVSTTANSPSGVTFQANRAGVVPAGVPCDRIQARYRSSVAGCETTIRDPRGAMTREELIDLNVKFQREVMTFVNFDFDKDALRPDARRVLNQQADWIKQYGNLRFSVFGHTDLVGSTDYNFDLAKRRADNVVSYLITQGVSPEQLESVVSFGKTQPIINTPNPEERNRRAVTEVSGYLRVGGLSLVSISCGYLDSSYLPTYSGCIVDDSGPRAALASPPAGPNPPSNDDDGPGPGGPGGPGNPTTPRNAEVSYGFNPDGTRNSGSDYGTISVDNGNITATAGTANTGVSVSVSNGVPSASTRSFTVSPGSIQTNP